MWVQLKLHTNFVIIRDTDYQNHPTNSDYRDHPVYRYFQTNEVLFYRNTIRSTVNTTELRSARPFNAIFTLPLITRAEIPANNRDIFEFELESPRDSSTENNYQ